MPRRCTRGTHRNRAWQGNLRAVLRQALRRLRRRRHQGRAAGGRPGAAVGTVSRRRGRSGEERPVLLPEHEQARHRARRHDARGPRRVHRVAGRCRRAHRESAPRRHEGVGARLRVARRGEPGARDDLHHAVRPDRAVSRLARVRSERLSHDCDGQPLLRAPRSAAARARNVLGGFLRRHRWRSLGARGGARPRQRRERAARGRVVRRGDRGDVRRRAEHRRVRAGRRVPSPDGCGHAARRAGDDPAVPGRPRLDARARAGAVERARRRDGQSGLDAARHVPGHVHSGAERGRDLSVDRGVDGRAREVRDHGEVSGGRRADHRRVHGGGGRGASARRRARLPRADRASCPRKRPGARCAVQAAGESGRADAAGAAPRTARGRGPRCACERDGARLVRPPVPRRARTGRAPPARSRACRPRSRSCRSTACASPTSDGCGPAR